jgi:thiamine biosynthesis protein ThiS
MVNGVLEDMSSSMTISEFLKLKDLNSSQVVVERNGVIIKSSDYFSTSLNDEDRLEILRILGGG